MTSASNNDGAPAPEADLSISDILEIYRDMDPLDRIIMAEPLMLARGILRGGLVAARVSRKIIEERKAEAEAKAMMRMAAATARLEAEGVPREVIAMAQTQRRGRTSNGASGRVG